jgi:mRNA-degrading endonuclease RelE of RelBE toxin-antitoxin system
MAYRIEFTDLAEGELKAIRGFDRRQIADAIDEQLTHQPNVETRNRKQLKGMIPAFEHVLPVWELRVGNHRVFYDVDDETKVVYVRAVRLKEHGQTTEEIINERSSP